MLSRFRSPFWWTLVTGGLLGWSAFAQPLNADDAPSLEYQVKASFIFNFMQFVEWPDAIERSKEKPFVLCIVGQDRFGRALSEIAHESIRGKSIQVVHAEANDTEALAVCDVLFIGDGIGAATAAALSKVQSRPVLTIGEAAEFIEQGGIIRLFRVLDKIRFEIDVDKAKEVQLRFSSKLLRLAERVHGT